MEEKYNGKQPKLEELSSEEKNALWNCNVQYKNTSSFIKGIHKSLAHRFLSNIKKNLSNQDFMKSLEDRDIERVHSLCSSGVKEIKDLAMTVHNKIKIPQSTKAVTQSTKAVTQSTKAIEAKKCLSDRQIAQNEEFEISDTCDSSELKDVTCVYHMPGEIQNVQEYNILKKTEWEKYLEMADLQVGIIYTQINCLKLL